MSDFSGLSKGLVIKAPFIDWILEGRKTWELRSSATKQRGPIALILKGSGLVVGVANLIDSKGPLTQADMAANGHLHAVAPERLAQPDLAKYRHAWVMAGARRLSRPVPYVHRPGAVIWALLDPTVARDVVESAR